MATIEVTKHPKMKMTTRRLKCKSF